MAQAIGEEHMMMMAMMVMMMTVMMSHRHFGSRSSFAGGQADFKVDEVRAISEDSPTIRYRLGAEAWAFGRLHPREAVTFGL